MRKALVLVAAALGLLGPHTAFAQRIHRQTFETESTSLRLGLIQDGQVQLLEHGLVTDIIHSGEKAERLVVRITSGSFCPVEYTVPQSLVFDELNISAWVYVNRPGTQLLARVVLPKVIDPDTGKPAVTLLPGDRCDVSNRWRRLEISRPDLILQKQQQLLQAERKASVDITGAYIDALIFDIHSGLGDVSIHVDDIQMGPIVPVPKPADVASDQVVPLPLRGSEGQKRHIQMPEVRDQHDQNLARVVGDRLQLGNRPFFIRGIRQSKAPVQILREVGFNAIFTEWPLAGDMKSTIASTGMQVIPMLGQSPVQNASTPTNPTGLAIYLGDGLNETEIPRVRATVDSIRAVDPHRSRPITGEVKEAFASYSTSLDMVGASRSPLASAMTLADYRRWLQERRMLSRPGSLFWTWIQTSLPEEYCHLVYGHGYANRFRVPVGPQPDQIRLLTYTSLAAGYRGVAFDSDQSLAESAQGRARLLQLALLNLELTLIEPFLAEGYAPVLAKTSHPNVMAVVFQHKLGVLAVPIWSDTASQYVVGQSAVNGLQLTLGEAAESAQAYQISLGEVRALERQSDISGFRVTIPEFDSIAFVVMTTDTTLISRYQELIQQIGPDAAAWYTELAELELAKTEEINARLEANGYPFEEAARLLIQSREHLEQCREYQRQSRHRLAVTEASRSLRVARALQRRRWEQATKGLSVMQANPFALSFYTLPEFYEFQKGIEQAQFGENLLPSGDFERDGNLGELGWSYNSHSSQNLHRSAYLVGGNPKEGRRSLQLRVASESEEPIVVVENSHAEMVSPPIRVQPGQVVRVSGFVRLPRGVEASVDGAVVWDSMGGRALALRFNRPSDWTPFAFYRPVTRSGEMRIHLGMTGLGDALFDDLRVEIADNANVPLAGQDRSLLR